MSTRTHSRSRTRLLISAALLVAAALPALAAATACQAAEFDDSSTTIVNPWIGLVARFRDLAEVDDYRLTGTGLLDGSTQMHTLTGLETILGVECRIYSIDVSGTAGADEHYDVRVAQDVEGNVRYLKVTGQDASGAAVDWTAPSAAEAPVLYPAEFVVGQRLTWWNGRTLEVVADGVLLPRFDNGMGPYYRCVEIVCTDGASTRRQWYCRYLGIVKEDCTVATTTTKTAKVPAGKSKSSSSRSVKVVRPAAKPAPAPTADPAGWQRAFDIEDVFPCPSLLFCISLNTGGLEGMTIGDLQNVVDVDMMYLEEPVTLEGLQMCDNLEALHVAGEPFQILSLDPLTRLSHLQWICLYATGFDGLSPLAQLADLRVLQLLHVGECDIAPLGGLTSLEHLHLEHGSISNIAALANLTQLQTLILDNNHIEDVGPLVGLDNLGVLSLDGNRINDISPLADLASLACLEIEGNPVSDLSPLSGKAQLECLDASNCCIDTLPAFPPCSRLKVLRLGGNCITDVSRLANATELAELLLWNNQISDISPLSGLVNLQTLSLSNNQVVDLSPLAGLTSLEFLYVNCNPVTALPAWTDTVNLERLYASFTGLSDLSPLREAPNLGWLDVSCANVTDLSPLAELTNLWYVDVSWNRISDLSPLSQLPRVGSFLWLQGNLIEDLGPLVDNPGIGYGDVISVFSNPLRDEAVNVQVPALTSRGVKVHTEGKLNVGTKVSCEWLYRNTALATGDRHAVVVQLTAGTDWYKNSAYDVSAALNYGDNFFVQLEPTDDPMVWIVRSTRRETNLPRDVRITFTVTGRDHGGQATTTRPLVVRPLGDVDGDGGVEPSDMAALINALNGRPPEGFDPEAFDLDADGGAEPGDLSVLINILNGLPIP